MVGVRRVVLATGRPVRRYLLSGVRGSINSVTAVGCGALAVNGVVSAVDRCAAARPGRSALHASGTCRLEVVT